MTQIVVDTNVLVHSCNPGNAYFAQAVELVEKLRDSDCIICVDEGLDANEAQNRSMIWSEYLQHIPQPSLATEMLSELLSTLRVADYPKKTDQQTHNTIRQHVSDPTDRVFVKIAFNSDSVALVSHDEAAFPQQTRTHLRQSNIANVVDCYGVPPL